MSSNDLPFQEDILPMVIILGRKKQIHRLLKTASQIFDSIRVIESLPEVKRPPTCLSARLAIITDSFPGGMKLSLVNQVKKKFNPETLICLSNTISPEAEIELRSAGLIFLGSYQAFFDRVDAVIRI